MSTIPQLTQLKQRLNTLSIQKARYGIAADPHIDIEISELETVVQQMGLIDIHRRNLDQLLKQRDKLGVHVPPHISNQIISERAEIVRLRQVCARLGQSVPAHPIDDDQEPELPPINDANILPPTNTIQFKLGQIKQLIREIEDLL